jgi:hypothetical protein
MLEAARTVPSDVAWIFGDIRLVRDQGDDGTIFSKFGLELDGNPQVFEDSISVQLPFQFGLLQGSLIRKRALTEVKAFEEGLSHSEDFLAGVQVACRYRFAAIRAVVTRMHRTSDLMSSSLDLAGRKSPDYHLARMKAFSLIKETGRAGQWGESYAEAVRGLCKSLGEGTEGARATSFHQFRYGISAKSVAFCVAAMLGRPGLNFWEKLGRVRRDMRGQQEVPVFKV